MKKVVRSHLILTLVPACLLCAQAALAQETLREDKHYVGLLVTAFNHRSIGTASNETATGTGGTLIAGGHLNELFHAELRAGGGFRDAKVPRGDLSLSIDYFASWYIGLHYPITNYANIYGQAGFSFIQGAGELSHPEENRNAQFRELEGDFPDSSFGVGWLLGLDVEVLTDTYLVFEGGKLLKDTGTDANIFQFSAGLKYEF
ncbi:outer membrane beta-barrel protein [Marinobacter sp.]|uniref:outer membrane beta-barrel protein n=1 Tax=Marinobacter sp. TaxID=50741 RepID=UPI001B76CDF1|nr:outer membrane beta-barrel protein [Marinobacter sp.]MBQ0831067.1 porin family protein [Marinobacter sp.]